MIPAVLKVELDVLGILNQGLLYLLDVLGELILANLPSVISAVC